MSPLEWTWHNIAHLVGPSDLSNFYLRQVIHLTYDPATGDTKVEVWKDEVLCK